MTCLTLLALDILISFIVLLNKIYRFIMKILIDARSITTKSSGIGRYTIELIKGYVLKYGHENVVVILNSYIKDFPYNFITWKYNRHTIWGTILFSFFLLRKEYDIYHSSDLIGCFWYKKNKKHIITVHDLMFITISNFFGKTTLRTRLRIIKNKILFFLILKNADLIISVSKTTKNDVQTIYNLDSIIVREGVNNIPKNDLVKPKITLEKETFFLYVGLGSPHKNIDFMIDSFLKSKSNKKLVICGKGHNLIESDRIIYLGYVDDSILHYLYSNCCAFIFPSLYEGFGLPILEALSYNCKVLSSNGGALKEFSNQVITFFDPLNTSELIMLIENVDNITVDYMLINEYLKEFNWDEIWNEFHENIIN